MSIVLGLLAGAFGHLLCCKMSREYRPAQHSLHHVTDLTVRLFCPQLVAALPLIDGAGT